MKKLLATAGLFAMSCAAFAADPLHNTTWRTIDDTTKKPKAIVKFTESNGVLSATIQQVLTPGEEAACKSCSGPYKNKSLRGVTVVQNLKSAGGNKYQGGKIIDPKTGKDYKLEATLKGNSLDMRGYIGISALGRTQTWQRVN
ncbi:MAG: DUF2147 domain-containing protein [Acinetobacter sp.]|nr:DUF2147 domain-containing protein [Acinetobacter sp.]